MKVESYKTDGGYDAVKLVSDEPGQTERVVLAVALSDDGVQVYKSDSDADIVSFTDAKTLVQLGQELYGLGKIAEEQV